MPPILALILTAGFVIYLFRRDFRQQPNITKASWIPTVWLFIIGTRTVAQWLSLGGVGMTGSLDEGTPLDAVIFFGLIIAGAVVLYQRRIRLGEIFSNNRWLTIFLIYCFLAIFWSDFPFIAFKRWIKILGHPIMALVLFTEPDPEEAIGRMIKRCAYFIIPVSILFIKYYPQWGRSWSPFGGEPELTGVTLDKNTLGSMGLIFGLYFCHRWLKACHQERTRERTGELIFYGAGFALNFLMLNYAKSSTSTVGMFIGILMMLFIGRPFVTSRNLAPLIIGIVVVLGLSEWLFGIYEFVLDFLHKNANLTDRVPLWNEVIAMQPNMLIGAGFESFWLGDRLATIWANHWWHPQQAHDGYIETYLNLGLIGLALMIILILNAFGKACRMLDVNFEFARFRLGFVTAFIFYNCTEAAFKATHPVWFVFYIVAIEYAMRVEEPVSETGLRVEPSEDHDSFEGEIVV